jgi:3-methyladenine DNA glycosylase AlkD
MLYKLAASSVMWHRRVAVVACLAFIKRGDFGDIFALCARLLSDTHDLMHKACGWMLREVGKRDAQALRFFLKKNYARMPRTMLRYAIERFDAAERALMLKGRF